MISSLPQKCKLSPQRTRLNVSFEPFPLPFSSPSPAESTNEIDMTIICLPSSEVELFRQRSLIGYISLPCLAPGAQAMAAQTWHKHDVEKL